LLQLFTGAKSFVDNPLIGSRRLNRLGLHTGRVRLAQAMANWRRRSLASGIAPDLREAFERDGFILIPDYLPAEQFEVLRRDLLDVPRAAREHRQGDTVTRRVGVDETLLRTSPALRSLIGSPRWKGMMRYVASDGGNPLYHVQSILTDGKGPPDPQRTLHADAFHPALKAWLFLTDVAENEGPLVYVRGSQRLTPARLDWEHARSLDVLEKGERLSQRGSLRIGIDELASLGLDEPVRFAVPANTLVLIDTFGFHARGASSGTTARAELWSYRRRSPFIPWSVASPLSWPGIAERRLPMSFGILDWLDRMGWVQQHWRPVGARRPLDR